LTHRNRLPGLTSVLEIEVAGEAPAPDFGGGSSRMPLRLVMDHSYAFSGSTHEQPTENSHRDWSLAGDRRGNRENVCRTGLQRGWLLSESDAIHRGYGF